jgi:formylglycine-generating enzyme required for sulfatase activity
VLRSANRHRHLPDGRYTAIGLRLVKELDSMEERTLLLPGSIPLRVVRIPAGRFQMGSPTSEVGHATDEAPVREVSISRPFWLGAWEVTQEQWQSVMGSNPSTFQPATNASQLPVERVSWNDAQDFLNRLNALGLGRFRLPTEAEWEYAARAGSSERFSFGDDPGYRTLANHAWFYSRAEGRSHPVGAKRPNAWNLYDMYGNVWEWCSDWFAPYSAGPAVDPQGPPTGREKVIRGGSWFNEPEALRSANRHRHPPESRQTNLGLRIVWEEE